ncbi:MAG: Smr/MutS family protein [Pseudomonadota bacterium]|nr:Smr/MutS family protein [Gammaproteobacteria bacterium]MBU1730706.1 Smr/MutS family protein [Gammaproteobacteria bacterium]MBU1893210.1 Smr/MutS family protein [Gammaproteobacteria bacterium]
MDEDDLILFRAAVGDARPLRHGPRFLHPLPKPKPIPLQSLRDQHDVLHDSLSDHVYWADSIESGEELAFLRPGLQNQVLRKLRRGHWVTQGEMDLHGLTVAEAKLELIHFLQYCQKNGLRCIRIIHGKGLRSKNREPVLKNKVAHWLMQRDETLAFCQARATDGGSGAMLVLLKAY